MSDDDLLQTFFQECEDLLTLMDEGLRDLQQGEAHDETINAVFRSVHSIKGGAGAFNLSALVKFSHPFETLLDELRAPRLSLDERIVETLLVSGDFLADLVLLAGDGRPVDEGRMQNQLALFNEFLGSEEETADEDVSFEPVSLDFGASSAGATRDVELCFRPGKQMFFAGHEPLLLLRALHDFGEVSSKIITDDLPTFAELDLEETYLSWKLVVRTSATVA